MSDVIRPAMEEAFAESDSDMQVWDCDCGSYKTKFDKSTGRIHVFKSPYVTYARRCSPPNRDYGDIGTRGEHMTFCLGPEFHDAPYDHDIFDITDGEEVDSPWKQLADVE